MVGKATDSEPGWTFVVVWFGIVGANAHPWLWRVAYRLDPTDSTLRWRSEPREGAVALAEVGSGPPLVVVAGPGFGAFCREVARATPGARIEYRGISAADR